MHWLSAAAPIVCFLLIFVDTKRATDLKNDDDWKPCQKTGTCGDSDNNDDDDDDDDNNRDVNYDEELEKNVQKKQWNVTTQGCSNCGESTPSGGCGGTNENDEIISPEVIDNYGSGTDSETPSGDVDCDCKHDGCKGSDVAEDEDGMDCGMSCHSQFLYVYVSQCSELQQLAKTMYAHLCRWYFDDRHFLVVYQIFVIL